MVLLFSCALPAVDQHQTAQDESPGLRMDFVLRRHVCSYGGFASVFGVLIGFAVVLWGSFSLRAILKKSKQLLLEGRRKRSGFQTDIARNLNTFTWDAYDKDPLEAQSQQKQNFPPI